MSRCSDCGAAVDWRETAVGWRLFNEDGTPHDCPQGRLARRARWRKEHGKALEEQYRLRRGYERALEREERTNEL